MVDCHEIVCFGRVDLVRLWAPRRIPAAGGSGHASAGDARPARSSRLPHGLRQPDPAASGHARSWHQPSRSNLRHRRFADAGTARQRSGLQRLRDWRRMHREYNSRVISASGDRDPVSRKCSTVRSSIRRRGKVKIDHFREPRADGKFAVVLAVLGVLAVAAVFGMSASAARAASGKPTTVTFVSHPTTVTPLNNYTQLPHGIQPNEAFSRARASPTSCRPALHSGSAVRRRRRRPGAPTQVPNAPGGPGASTVPAAPAAAASWAPTSTASRTSASGRMTGFHYTPPDQGLCVGPAGPLEGAGVNLGVPGNTSVVVEMVNDGWGVYRRAASSSARQQRRPLRRP